MEKHFLSSEEYNQLLKEIDELFKQSVKRVYEKDKEYNYKHCATLSGGLDSRLVVMTAQKLGYETLCLSMGESDCADIRISTEICRKQKLEHLIYELDNGLHLFDYDRAIIGNGATILSPGYLHSFRLKSLVNFTQYGAIHSGDCGDAILGGSLLHSNGQGVRLDDAMYGSEFLDGFTQEFKDREMSRYHDQYQFNYYNRGLNSAGNGCIATQCYTECSSPFIDKDLLELMFKVPYPILKDHKVYIDYIRRYLPEANEFTWDGIACKPCSSRIYKFFCHYFRSFKIRVFRKNISMNPYDEWYKHNIELSEMFRNIFRSAEKIKESNNKLYTDLLTRYTSDKFMDKSLACTLVRFIDYYNINV